MQDKKNQLSLDELLKVDLERDPAFVLPQDDAGASAFERFKGIVSFLESSGGKNLNHRPITEGLQAGTTAQGAMGLMPHTAKEFANRRKLAGRADDIDRNIIKSDPLVVQEMIAKNPALRSRYEDEMIMHVLDRSGGDMGLAATKWLHGHNNPILETKEIWENSPVYQQRFKEAKRLVLEKEQKERKKLEKIPESIRKP